MKREEREQRRDTFLADARDYDAARPQYPGPLLAEAAELAGLSAGDAILEFGCGTGQATKWFAERGYRMLALDRSEEMLRRAAAGLGAFTNVELRRADFEALPVTDVYAAVLSATSFHWLDPADRVERCASHLAPGGSLILLWHTHPRPFTGFFERVQPIYRAVAPEWRAPPSPGMLEERLQKVVSELTDGGVFEEPRRRSHDWSRTFDRPGYEQLMRTYSDHMLLDEGPRKELLERVGALIEDEFDGRVERPYRTELIVARRGDSTG